MSNPPPIVPVAQPAGYSPPDPFGSRPRTSGLAIASLVSGIVGCMGFTAIAAIICGILGIRQTRKPNVTGRGMAIAGLILGLLWLPILAAVGIGGVIVWRNSEAPVAVARQFTTDLAAGRLDAALAQTSGITAAEIDAQHQGIAPWGALTNFSMTKRSVAQANGFSTWSLDGTATFATGGEHRTIFSLTSTKTPGEYKVLSFVLVP